MAISTKLSTELAGQVKQF
jgi:hypothetical protein